MSNLLKWVLLFVGLIVLGQLIKWLVQRFKLYKVHRFFDYQQKHWKKENGKWTLK